MKLRNVVLALAVVSLLVAMTAFAKNNVPGDVPAPTWTVEDLLADPPVPAPVVLGADDVTFNWNDVEEAEQPILRPFRPYATPRAVKPNYYTGS